MEDSKMYKPYKGFAYSTVKEIYEGIMLTVCAVGIVFVAIGLCLCAKKEPCPVIVVCDDVVQTETECNGNNADCVNDYCGVGDIYDPAVVTALARLVWGEARGCPADEQAAVVWCVLNRVDSDLPYFPDTVMEVIEQPNAFSGYAVNNPVTPELSDLAIDVLTRWKDEKAGCENVGRVLPADYLYFTGDGKHNYFRDAYKGGNTFDMACSVY